MKTNNIESATFANQATARAFIQDCREAGVKVTGNHPKDGDKWSVSYESHILAPSLVSYRQSAGYRAPVIIDGKDMTEALEVAGRPIEDLRIRGEWSGGSK